MLEGNTTVAGAASKSEGDAGLHLDGPALYRRRPELPHTPCRGYYPFLLCRRAYDVNVPAPSVDPDDDAHRNRGVVRAGWGRVDTRKETLGGCIIFDANRHRAGAIGWGAHGKIVPTIG